MTVRNGHSDFPGKGQKSGITVEESICLHEAAIPSMNKAERKEAV
jgi:hypothetical protein